jgi:N utilization substance protein A
MHNEELLSVLDNIEREKGVDKEILFSAIESALASAARKIMGNKEAEVVVTIDRATGEIKILSEGKEIKSAEFGRIAAQTAKQVIIQKIREAERDIISDEYTKRVGMITSGAVHRFEKGDIIIDLGKTEAVLPRAQQCPGERYKQGDRIRAYIMEVNKTSHGPQVILSRSDSSFVKKLFEIEVPEIAEGVVEVRAVAREAGDRTKIAVWSKDDKVDPVGACVGMRGARVKDIVRELHGERVDIVRWSEDIKDYVKGAINPAEPIEIKVDKINKKVSVIVPDDQLSIGIGRHGQNVRLASKLVGWDIDIKGKELKPKVDLLAEAAATAEQVLPGAEGADALPSKTPATKPLHSITGLTKLEGVGKKTAELLMNAGYDTVEKIKALTLEDLTKLEGIGKKLAEKIMASAKENK